MKYVSIITVILLGMAGLSQGGIITFDESDGYTNGNAVAIGSLSPDSSFSYAQNGQGSGSIEGQALKLTGPGVGQYGTCWVKDSDVTAYNSISGKWYRSVDVTIDSATTGTFSGDKIGVSLMNGTLGDGTALDWTEYQTNFAMDVFIFKKDETTGQFWIRRRNADNTASECYNSTTEAWVTSFPVYQYDLSHTLNVAYVYDSDLAQMAVTVFDVTAASSLVSVVVDEADLAPFVGGDNTVRFGAGDLWQSSSRQMVAELDNISNVPEPATLPLVLLSAVCMFVHRRIQAR